MLVLCLESRHRRAALQQLFYYIRPPLHRMLGEGIPMLVLCLESKHWKAAAQQLFYNIPYPLDNARGGDPISSSLQ